MKRQRVDDAVSGDIQFTVTPAQMQKESVRSLIKRVGECDVALELYPRGTGQGKGTDLSLFLSVIPSPDWQPEWSFPDVSLRLTAFGDTPGLHETKTLTRSYNAKSKTWGWQKFLKVADLEKENWLSPLGALRLEAMVSGNSLSISPRVVPSIGKQLWTSGKFTDMVIVAGEGGSEIACHRAMLATVSDVFDAMLRSEMSEGSSSRVVMADASEDSIRLMLQHIYIGTIRSSDVDLLLEGMSLGEKYNLGGLQADCASQLAPLISESNVCRASEMLARCSKEPEVQKHYDMLTARLQGDTDLLKALLSRIRAVHERSALPNP